jgi:hypothetical protein
VSVRTPIDSVELPSGKVTMIGQMPITPTVPLHSLKLIPSVLAVTIVWLKAKPTVLEAQVSMTLEVEPEGA